MMGIPRFHWATCGNTTNILRLIQSWNQPDTCVSNASKKQHEVRGGRQGPRQRLPSEKNMTELTHTKGRRPGKQTCRGTLLAILFSALWLLHSGGVMAQAGTDPGS